MNDEKIKELAESIYNDPLPVIQYLIEVIEDLQA